MTNDVNFRCITTVFDNGYSAICPRCVLRFDPKPRLINHPREVVIRKCRKCESLPEAPTSYTMRMKSKGVK